MSYKTALLFDAVQLEASAELSGQRNMEGLLADDGTLRRMSTPTTSRRSLSSQAPERQVSLPALLALRCSLSGGGALEKAGGAVAPFDAHPDRILACTSSVLQQRLFTRQLASPGAAHLHACAPDPSFCTVEGSTMGVTASRCLAADTSTLKPASLMHGADLERQAVTGMVLPFDPLALSFHDLCYYVPLPLVIN